MEKYSSKSSVKLISAKYEFEVLISWISLYIWYNGCDEFLLDPLLCKKCCACSLRRNEKVREQDFPSIKIVNPLVHLYIKNKIKRPFDLENMRKSLL